MTSQILIALSAPVLSFFIGSIAFWLWASGEKNRAELALAISLFIASGVFIIVMGIPLMNETISAILLGTTPLASFVFGMYAVQTRLKATTNFHRYMLAFGILIQLICFAAAGLKLGSAVFSVETTNILFYALGTYLLIRFGKSLPDRIAIIFFSFGCLLYAGRVAAFSLGYIALPNPDTFLEPGYFAFIQLSTTVIVVGAGLAILAGFVEDRMAQKRTEYLTDQLSGLPNRQAFMEAVQLALQPQPTVTEKADHWLLLCDIDHFKKINDVYGHPVGDMVIEKIGSIFRSISCKEAIAGRIGGEEFALLLPNTCENTAREVAIRLGQAISMLPMPHDFNITASFGGSNFSKSGDFSKAMKMADKALYQAKNQGRNRAVLHLSKQPEKNKHPFKTLSADQLAA